MEICCSTIIIKTIMSNNANIARQIEHLKKNTNVLGLMTLVEYYAKKIVVDFGCNSFDHHDIQSLDDYIFVSSI